jgi:hypothetical protein
MSRILVRGDHCRKQASQCAVAAAAATLVEVKEAYLNLQQGWLVLAADLENGRTGSINQPPENRDHSGVVDAEAAPCSISARTLRSGSPFL